jgi:hypothetical protein
MTDLETEVRMALGRSDFEDRLRILNKRQYNNSEHEEIAKSISYANSMMKYYSSKDFKLFHDLFLMELKEKPHIQEHMVEKGISEMHLFGAQIYLAGFYVNQDELVKRVMHIAEKEGIDSAVAQKHLPKLWIPNYAEIYSRAKPVISDLAITRVAMMVDDFPRVE